MIGVNNKFGTEYKVSYVTFDSYDDHNSFLIIKYVIGFDYKSTHQCYLFRMIETDCSPAPGLHKSNSSAMKETEREKRK